MSGFRITTDQGEERKIERDERWTNQCADGRACERWDRNPATRAFVPDDQRVCDDCLVARFGLADHGTHDALDHLGMDTLYPADRVIRALRLAVAGGEDTAWLKKNEKARDHAKKVMAQQEEKT